MNFTKRTHTCGALRLENDKKDVTLNGWIETRRDLGNLIFLDLRDRYGVTQVVLDTSDSPELMKVGHELRTEFVIAVNGKVRSRPEEARNKTKATGDIEVVAESIEVINRSKTPPFEISDEVQVSDEIRLKYRYLDIRRSQLSKNLMLRHKVFHAMRNALSERDFMEVETPFLTKSTPEGARDFLVPSRVNAGRFYALPQSPQLFKQLLMVGGIDRYFQIVKCMRDEDLRADRQPEFTQIDMEMSFVDEEDVLSIMEEVAIEVTKAVGNEPEATPFPRMTHTEAMTRFGSDKPDIRFGMEFFSLNEVVLNTKFKVFSSVVKSGGVVLGINASGCASYSRKDIDGLTSFVQERGAKGLAWFKVGEGELTSPIAKFFKQEEQAAIIDKAGAAKGDLIMIIAAPESTARLALGELRVEMGKRLDLMGDQLAFCWITEFPMFDKDEETGDFTPSHHPFTMPREEYEGHLEKDPKTLKSRAYDLVLNGVELGSGSVRIHDRNLQTRIFKSLKIDEETAKGKFGFLLDAFEYGAPPHAGIALGLDRMVMILAGMTNIRDVIAFPKTASGGCPLTGAPGQVENVNLEELSIEIKESKDE